MLEKIDEINGQFTQEVIQQRQKVSEGVAGVKKTLLMDLESRVAQIRENHLIVIRQIEEKNNHILQQKDQIIERLTNNFNKIPPNQTQTSTGVQTTKISTGPNTPSIVHELNIMPKEKEYHSGEIIKSLKEILNIEETKLKIITIRNSPKGIFIKFETNETP